MPSLKRPSPDSNSLPDLLNKGLRLINTANILNDVCTLIQRLERQLTESKGLVTALEAKVEKKDNTAKGLAADSNARLKALEAQFAEQQSSSRELEKRHFELLDFIGKYDFGNTLPGSIRNQLKTYLTSNEAAAIRERIDSAY